MVNSIKLTRQDEVVLKAIAEGYSSKEYEDLRPSEGVDTKTIALRTYGEEVENVEKRGGHYVSNRSICNAAKSSLSRTLKKLWKNGLVKKGFPSYRRYWCKEDWSDIRYYTKDLSRIDTHWLNEKGVICQGSISVPPYARLPHRTRVWWSLTDLGNERIGEASP